MTYPYGTKEYNHGRLIAALYTRRRVGAGLLNPARRSDSCMPHQWAGSIRRQAIQIRQHGSPRLRQKKPAPLRFPGCDGPGKLRMRRFLLPFRTEPALPGFGSGGRRNAVRRQASGLTPWNHRRPPIPAQLLAAPAPFFCLVFPDAGVELRLLSVHAPGR